MIELTVEDDLIVWDLSLDQITLRTATRRDAYLMEFRERAKATERDASNESTSAGLSIADAIKRKILVVHRYESELERGAVY